MLRDLEFCMLPRTLINPAEVVRMQVLRRSIPRERTLILLIQVTLDVNGDPVLNSDGR